MQLAGIDQGGVPRIPGRIELAALQRRLDRCAENVAIAAELEIGRHGHGHVPHLRQIERGELGAEGVRDDILDHDAEHEPVLAAVLLDPELEIERLGRRFHRYVAGDEAVLPAMGEIDLRFGHGPFRDLLTLVEIDGGVADAEAGEKRGFAAAGLAEDLVEGVSDADGASAGAVDHAFARRLVRPLRGLSGLAGPDLGGGSARRIGVAVPQVGLGVARIGEGEGDAPLVGILKKQLRADEVDLAGCEPAAHQRLHADFGGRER